MRSIIVLASALALLVSSAALATGDQVECPQEPKFLKRYPGSYIASCEFRDFDQTEVWTSDEQTKAVEGEVTSVTYSIEGATGLQLYRNYETALKQGGFTMVYASKPTITAQLNKGNSVVWVKVNAYDGAVELTTIRVKSMEQHVAVVDAVGFLEELNARGTVSVYGINFETGLATVKPESAKVLGEILKLLQQNPKLELLVVGHTDSVGGVRANLDLSDKRAAAVRDWLVKNGCDARRLVTRGFGDRAPLAENDSEEGRARNRRVELVKL